MHHRLLPRASARELRDDDVHRLVRDERNAEADLRLRERFDHDDGYDRHHNARDRVPALRGRDELLGHLAPQLIDGNRCAGADFVGPRGVSG